VTIDEQTIRVPHIVAEVQRLAKPIHASLVSKDSAAENAWANEVDRQTAYMNLPIKVSKIYFAEF
jgi:hypothetical protein